LFFFNFFFLSRKIHFFFWFFGSIRLSHELYYFNERILFLSHNKSVNNTFGHGFSAKR